MQTVNKAFPCFAVYLFALKTISLKKFKEQKYASLMETIHNNAFESCDIFLKFYTFC